MLKCWLAFPTIVGLNPPDIGRRATPTPACCSALLHLRQLTKCTGASSDEPGGLACSTMVTRKASFDTRLAHEALNPAYTLHVGEIRVFYSQRCSISSAGIFDQTVRLDLFETRDPQVTFLSVAGNRRSVRRCSRETDNTV